MVISIRIGSAGGPAATFRSENPVRPATQPTVLPLDDPARVHIRTHTGTDAEPNAEPNATWSGCPALSDDSPALA